MKISANLLVAPQFLRLRTNESLEGLSADRGGKSIVKVKML